MTHEIVLFCFCQQQLITDAELNGADIYIPVSLDANLRVILTISQIKFQAISSHYFADSLNLTCDQAFLVRLIAGYVEFITRNYREFGGTGILEPISRMILCHRLYG